MLSVQLMTRLWFACDIYGALQNVFLIWFDMGLDVIACRQAGQARHAGSERSEQNVGDGDVEAAFGQRRQRDHQLRPRVSRWRSVQVETSDRECRRFDHLRRQRTWGKHQVRVPCSCREQGRCWTSLGGLACCQARRRHGYVVITYLLQQHFCIYSL